MCTLRERTYSFAELCKWIRELSNSIRELSNSINELTNTPTRLQYEKKKNGIRELGKVNLENPLIQLESSLIQLEKTKPYRKQVLNDL